MCDPKEQQEKNIIKLAMSEFRKMKSTWISFSAMLLIQVTITKSADNGLSSYSMGRPYPVPIIETKHVISEEWFEQKLDNFDPFNHHTWKQKYLMNTEFYEEALRQNKTGMPVFLMIEGEGGISSYWSYGGYWLVPAKEHGALLLQVEHRFYGDSHPSENLTVESLQYLTSEQALADFAIIIKSLKTKMNLTDENKVIAFGGSYGGALASWMRLKYPDIVYAAIASSAPVEAKVEFYEYFDIVEDTLRKYDERCLSAITDGINELKKMTETNLGCKTISSLFNTCTELDPNNHADIEYFFRTLSQFIGHIVQYSHHKYGRIASTPIDNLNVTDLCDILTDENEKSSLNRLVNLTAVVANQSCININKTLLDEMYVTSTTWESEKTVLGYRQWMYQSCNEFGYFQTSNAKDEFFDGTLTVHGFEQTCAIGYTDRFSHEEIARKIQYTNSVFEGKTIKNGKRIVYVHGSVDPWRPMGITESKSDDIIVIIIEGTSHVADMYPHSYDSADLKEARSNISQHLRRWLEKN